MGCDIHLHLEIKKNGIWEHYSEANVNRDYRFFAYIANVRNDELQIQPLSFPKGLPDDLNELTQMDIDRWGDDGHSHSFLTADEIKKAYEFLNNDEIYKTWQTSFETKRTLPYLFGNYLNDFQAEKETYFKGVEDVRWIFFFDN